MGLLREDGSSGRYDDKVAELQKELVDKGFDIGKYGKNKDGIDGIYGPRTKAADEANKKGENPEEFNKKNKFTSSDVTNINDKSIKNFHKIPLGNNNYRSAEPTASALAGVIQKYGIKNVVRFNGDGADSYGLSIDEERKICEQNGCSFHKLSSTRHQDKVNKLLDDGNTLIHCRHGADRTGGNIGGWLHSKGWGDTKKIWDYTTQYNSWEDYIRKSPTIFVRDGYLKQAQKFGVRDLDHARQLSR